MKYPSECTGIGERISRLEFLNSNVMRFGGAYKTKNSSRSEDQISTRLKAPCNK
jgi:hypothetical protein